MPVQILTPAHVFSVSFDGFNSVALDPGQNYGFPPGLDWVDRMVLDGLLIPVEVPEAGPFQAWDLSRHTPTLAPLVQGHFFYTEEVPAADGVGEASPWIPSQVPESVGPPSKLLNGLPPRRRVQEEAKPEAQAKAEDAPAPRAPKRRASAGGANA